jgi:hypothetical protein
VKIILRTRQSPFADAAPVIFERASMFGRAASDRFARFVTRQGLLLLWALSGRLLQLQPARLQAAALYRADNEAGAGALGPA